MKEFADKNGMSYIEVSAKDSTNVEEAFMLMANEVMKRYLFFKGKNTYKSTEKE